jgi:hypothetical protein
MGFVDSAIPSRIARTLALAALAFRAQWYLFVIPVLYLASNAALLAGVPGWRRAPVGLVLLDLLSFALPIGIVMMLVLRLVQYALIVRPESPIRELGRDIALILTRPALIINALPVFAALVLFNKAAIELKPAIPLISPFQWDMAFMRLDRALHLGLDPWAALQPLLGFDAVTFAINIAYNFWFVALFAAWFWFGFQRQATELRTRFFLAYMLAWWLGGGLLAVTFSSAGPVYFDELGLAPNPYAPLFAYLNDVDTRIPLWFLDTQQMLWDGYAGKIPALGISAMPSMHNASAVLFALAFGQVSKRLGRFFLAYAAVILVGSVHLGWHYAVDGYAAVLLALAAWWAAGHMARVLAMRPATRRYNEGLASL